MKKTKRKIIGGAIVFGCAVFAMGALSVLGQSNRGGAIPVSVNYETEKPIIVLDAGHGGMDGGCSTADGVPKRALI